MFIQRLKFMRVLFLGLWLDWWGFCWGGRCEDYGEGGVEGYGVCDEGFICVYVE